MGLKMSEILMIMAVLLLLFGGSRLPQLGSSLGSAIRNFKKGFSGEDGPEPDEKAKEGGKLASGESIAPAATDKAATKQG